MDPYSQRCGFDVTVDSCVWVWGVYCLCSLSLLLMQLINGGALCLLVLNVLSIRIVISL